MTTTPRFLTYAEIMLIHQDQIQLYGGSPGLRDPALLSSALAMPQSSFAGEYLHTNLFEMAAAYLYHLCQNHPFIDGNKRVGLAAALVFLDLNGIEVVDPDQLLFELVMKTASGLGTKNEIAQVLKSLVN